MHTFIYEYMMDLVAPALSQKPAFVTYFVARGVPRPCYIPEGFDSQGKTTLLQHRRGMPNVCAVGGTDGRRAAKAAGSASAADQRASRSGRRDQKAPTASMDSTFARGSISVATKWTQHTQLRNLETLSGIHPFFPSTRTDFRRQGGLGLVGRSSARRCATFSYVLCKILEKAATSYDSITEACEHLSAFFFTHLSASADRGGP